MAISAHFGDLGPVASAHFGDLGPVTLPQKRGPRSLRPLWAEVTKVDRGHRNVGRDHLVRDGRGPRSPVLGTNIDNNYDSNTLTISLLK